MIRIDKTLQIKSNRSYLVKIFLKFFNWEIVVHQFRFNPLYALELRNEDLNSNPPAGVAGKSGSFIGFSIAPLWLNQKTQRSF